MSFAPGDIVQLKSGGPAMTVVRESSEGIHCIWFGEASDELRAGVVPAVCLETLVLDDEDLEEDEPAERSRRADH